MPNAKTLTVEEYIKETPPKKIHEDFIARVHNVLSRAKLKKDVYFDGIAAQIAEKLTVYMPEKKLIYKMEFKNKKWGYIKYKLQPEVVEEEKE